MPIPDPVRQLPANPNITQLKKQAKELKRAVEAGDPEAIERAHVSHPDETGMDTSTFTLRDAQLTIAREYGFEGWNALNTHVGEQMVDERDLHRWFGVQLNNSMWGFIEDDDVGPDTPILERERMLYSAYASAYHWRNVGNEANLARGEHLISRMAARIGEGELALRHALRCVELVEEHPDVMEDWDAPFAHEALARGYAAVGDQAAGRRHLEIARNLTKSVADDEDRHIIEAELGRGPWFGLE